MRLKAALALHTGARQPRHPGRVPGTASAPQTTSAWPERSRNPQLRRSPERAAGPEHVGCQQAGLRITQEAAIRTAVIHRGDLSPSRGRVIRARRRSRARDGCKRRPPCAAGPRRDQFDAVGALSWPGDAGDRSRRLRSLAHWPGRRSPDRGQCPRAARAARAGARRARDRERASTFIASAARCDDGGRGCSCTLFRRGLLDSLGGIRVRAALDAHEIYRGQRPNRFLAQYEFGD